ncbi:MAG: hypothetical protein AAF349_22220, partial [Cyanobacteria bacterium P01_A01_bin.68]
NPTDFVELFLPAQRGRHRAIRRRFSKIRGNIMANAAQLPPVGETAAALPHSRNGVGWIFIF